MVENSLGRLWIEGHPDDELKSGWKYYLDEAQQEPEVQAQLDKIRAEYAALKSQDIKVIDPCMGSGHILVYAFDLLIQIYKKYGVSERDAAQSILQYNLYGLDIDDRAAQLAYFAVMMKARQYDRRIFSRGIQPHVYALQNSGPMPAAGWGYLGEEGKIARHLLDSFVDAKEYGSLVKPEVTLEEMDQLQARLEKMDEMSSYGNLAVMALTQSVLDALCPLIELAQVLVQKYDVVVTNPPYMGSSNMDGKLSEFVKKRYPDSKSDLFAVFIERCGQMTCKNRYQAMITQHAWMFLSSFEKLRDKLLQFHDIVNMAHLGPRAFEDIGGEVVQTTSFVLRQGHIENYKGTYCRLIEPTTQQGKEDVFLAGENRYTAHQSNFSKIPGAPVAYWVSEPFIHNYRNKSISSYGTARSGLQTGDNNRFLRFWQEVDYDAIAFGMHSKTEFLETKKKWTPQIKGGEYRKWYGNSYYIVNWENDGAEIRKCDGCRLNAMGNDELFFQKGITWSHTTSGVFGARYLPSGCLFNVEAPTLFVKSCYEYYLLAYLNSIVAQYYLNAINMTLHYLVGNISNLPVTYLKNERVDVLTKKNVDISSADWDSYETSWDFKRHPMV